MKVYKKRVNVDKYYEKYRFYDLKKLMRKKRKEVDQAKIEEIDQQINYVRVN